MRELNSEMDKRTVASRSVEADGGKAAPSRRSFLTRAAGVSALAVPTLTLITSRKAQAAGAKKLTGLAAELINEIMSDEDQHVPIIQNLLDDPDNPLPVPIRQPPHLNMKRLKQPNLQAFLETASAFENTGSGLYHGALLNITQTAGVLPDRGRPGRGGSPSRLVAQLAPGPIARAGFRPGRGADRSGDRAHAGRGIRHRPPVDVPVVRHDRG